VSLQINVLLFPSFPNSHHLFANFPGTRGPDLSVRGVGRRTQPISKLLNDLLITSALNPTCLLQSALNPTCLLQVGDFLTHLYLNVLCNLQVSDWRY
jgi:hypothetical protein